ncbi:hypothetical protein EON77_10265 [bacterium]|nr:MAG: hypothetical protein EON77_10265 [bacterium]
MNADVDRRLLGQMREHLTSAPKDVSSLGRLVSDLEATSSSLTIKDIAWKQDFHEHWACLEEVFAVALDRSMLVLSEEFQGLVSEAVTGLRILVDKAVCTLSEETEPAS